MQNFALNVNLMSSGLEGQQKRTNFRFERENFLTGHMNKKKLSGTCRKKQALWSAEEPWKILHAVQIVVTKYSFHLVFAVY